MAKYLKGCYPSILLALDSQFVWSSALIAGTRKVSPLVKKIKIFKDIKADTIRIASRARNKNINIHDTYKGIALKHIHERTGVFVHWFILSTN